MALEGGSEHVGYKLSHDYTNHRDNPLYFLHVFHRNYRNKGNSIRAGIYPGADGSADPGA